LNAEVFGLQQAAVNAGQASSMLQIADGGMARIGEVLTRMKTLAVQSSSGQLSGTERAMIDTEYQKLKSEVGRIAQSTKFNGNQMIDGSIVVNRGTATAFTNALGVQDITFRGDFTDTVATIAVSTAGAFSVTTAAGAFTGTLGSNTNDGSSMTTGAVVTLSLAGSSNKIDLAINTSYDVDLTKATGTLGLSGSSSSSYTFKVGTGTASYDDISVSVHSVSATALGINTTDVTTAANAATASSAVSSAIDDLQTYRSQVGSSQGRLGFAAAAISTTVENTEAARSQLLDLDVAAEMTTFVSKQILTQAGVAMLAQAQKMPQNLLRLFLG
jgi:flagellin